MFVTKKEQNYKWYNEAKHLTNCQRAKAYFNEAWKHTEDNDLIVLKIDGLYCIARVENQLIDYATLTKVHSYDYHIKIDETVVPFDENNIYELQDIKKTIHFTPHIVMKRC